MKSAEEFYQLVGVPFKDKDELAQAPPTKVNKHGATQSTFKKCPRCSLPDCPYANPSTTKEERNAKLREELEREDTKLPETKAKKEKQQDNEGILDWLFE